MDAPSVGAVVVVRFPFSDLTDSKLRPAVVLADAGLGDWILCQVTSQRYSDREAVEITNSDFKKGSLRKTSYARPAKLFTANSKIISGIVGQLTGKKQGELLVVVSSLFETGVVE